MVVSGNHSLNWPLHFFDLGWLVKWLPVGKHFLKFCLFLGQRPILEEVV
jgi:hypothetical protein